ncbi:MAG: flagellar hook-associated protein FlgK [Alphaproteobacteria bacterium]|nr:flagellar hook-associated protein FlgK [Alphaproteobacteria bacterium]
MSLSGALNAALSGLQTSSTAAQIISSNVSNAQTEGYTRKSTNLAAVTDEQGGGVEIVSISRATDTVLFATLNSATSDAANLSTQNSYLLQIQSILDSTGNPPALSSGLNNFQAAWTQYAASPSDQTLQKSVVSTGQILATDINKIAEETAALKTTIENDLATNIGELNSALSSVQALNVQISAAISSGQTTTDLEDRRDQAILEIAQYTNVKILQRNNGQIALYTSNGTVLLDGQEQSFSIGAGGNTIVTSTGGDVTASLSGGSLEAQTNILSTTSTSGNGTGVIEKLLSQIQNFANIFIATTSGGTSFADIYNNAETGDSELASSFFTADIGDDGLPDLTSFSVNGDLASGAANVKASCATDICNAFSAVNLAVTTTYDEGTGTYVYSTGTTYSATGLTTQRQTFAGIATSILSGFQQAASNIKNQYTTASTQEAYFKSTYASETGVNTDSELVALTNWQNSYAASAHVISTIQSMMQTLLSMVNA